PGHARQVVVPDRAVRSPVKAADVPVGTAEDDDVRRANGIVVGPQVARRPDRVRLRGQVAMAHTALSLPPQLVKVAVGGAVTGGVKAVVSRDPPPDRRPSWAR